MRKELVKDLTITAEICCWNLSHEAWKVVIERLDEEYEPNLIAALKECREDPRIGRNALGSIIDAIKGVIERRGPRPGFWAHEMDEQMRHRWGKDEAGWLKAKAENDRHKESART